MNMHGFTNVEMSDHAFAAYLRRFDAIDQYGKQGKAVMWRDKDGNCMAVAIYDNAACERRIWIPDWNLKNATT